jgi:hypothetical protein
MYEIHNILIKKSYKVYEIHKIFYVKFNPQRQIKSPLCINDTHTKKV